MLLRIDFNIGWLKKKSDEGVRVVRLVEKWVASAGMACVKASAPDSVVVEIESSRRTDFEGALAKKFADDFAVKDISKFVSCSVLSDKNRQKSAGAGKDNLYEMLKYLTMANYSLLHGNFEMDVSDGEIRYKCWIETWQLDTLGGQQIDESLSVPLMMFERYGDGIAALALGFSDAETEINKAEAPDPDEEEDEAAGPEDGED